MSGRKSVEEKLVAVGEYQINVATAGTGNILVMLHGEDGRKGWKDWEGFQSLAAKNRLVMPDLVGFGKSSHPEETPDYAGQAKMVNELLDVMKVGTATLVCYSWGGQVGLEVALERPDRIAGIILVASTYDKSQIPRLPKVRRPTLIVWAEDDLVTQLKAGYLLRDAIRTSRIEVLPPVAKDPRHDFTYAHRLLTSRKDELLKLIEAFLSSPTSSTAEPPELEPELRGMALKHETPDTWGTGKKN